MLIEFEYSSFIRLVKFLKTQITKISLTIEEKNPLFILANQYYEISLPSISKDQTNIYSRFNIVNYEQLLTDVARFHIKAKASNVIFDISDNIKLSIQVDGDIYFFFYDFRSEDTVRSDESINLVVTTFDTINIKSYIEHLKFLTKYKFNSYISDNIESNFTDNDLRLIRPSIFSFYDIFLCAEQLKALILFYSQAVSNISSISFYLNNKKLILNSTSYNITIHLLAVDIRNNYSSFILYKELLSLPVYNIITTDMDKISNASIVRYKGILVDTKELNTVLEIANNIFGESFYYTIYSDGLYFTNKIAYIGINKFKTI